MSPADRAVAGGLRRGLAHRDPEGGGRGGWVRPPAGRGARPGGGGLLLLEGEHEAGKCPDVIITSLCCQAPEGDEVALTYTAGEAGYLAEGAALPLSPAVPEAPAVELPVMVDLTPEVAEARDAFMATFEEVKMRAEAMEAEAEPEPEAVESMERRRRDTEEAMVMEAAEMEDQVAMEDMAVEAVEGAAKFQVPPTLPRYLHFTYLQYLHIFTHICNVHAPGAGVPGIVLRPVLPPLLPPRRAAEGGRGRGRGGPPGGPDCALPALHPPLLPVLPLLLLHPQGGAACPGEYHHYHLILILQKTKHLNCRHLRLRRQ